MLFSETEVLLSLSLRELALEPWHNMEWAGWAEKESQDCSEFYEVLEAWRRRDANVKESRMVRVHD